MIQSQDPLTEEDNKLATLAVLTSKEENPIYKMLDTIMQQEVEKAVKEAMGKPQEVVIKNVSDIVIPPPLPHKEIQRVEGQVSLTKGSVATPEQVEEIVERIVETVVEKLKAPVIQKITGNVEATVNFPTVQIVKGEVVAKITETLKTNVPVVEGYGSIPFVPVGFWDGKRFIDPLSMGGSQSVQGQGKVANLLQQLVNERTEGWRPVTFSGVSNSLQTVRGSKGKFGGYFYDNPNSSKVYLQVFLDKTGVVLGTTAPDAVYSVPASGAANLELSKGLDFDQSMQVAATTQPNGAAAPTTPLPLTFYVNK